MIFLQRVLSLIESAGISRNKLLTDLGINKSSFFDWERRNTVPNGEVVAKIADYFDVSTDYLLGRTDEKSPSTTEAVPGDKNAPLYSSEVLDLAQDERQLIEDYRTLNNQGQEYIRQTMYMATQTYKKIPDLSDLEKQA